MAKIGFVGLGHMGLPMAKNLIKAGHIVTGYDLQSNTLKLLEKAGGIAANSIAMLARDKDVIITMLQSGQQVIDVCSKDEGLFANCQKNCLYIDCSTIDVASSRNIHHQAHIYNLSSLDAPVSGGVNGAIAGTLTFMVGGDAKDFNLARPILSCMGTKIIHAGDNGSGQSAKICNNLMLGISMIASSEAFILGRALGLSDKKLHEVITNASGQCWVMDKYVPVPNILDSVPANHNYKPGFTTAMMLKDLKLSQEAAKTMGVKTNLANLATQIYQKAFDNGFGDLDFSAIIEDEQS